MELLMSGAYGTKRKQLKGIDTDASEGVLIISSKPSEKDPRVICD